MPNKTLSALNEIDRELRMMFPTQMWDNGETIVNIRLYGGFEVFNTRPYHNYETWSSGYELTTGPRYGNLKVEAEDLDDAVRALKAAQNKWRESNAATGA